MNNATRTAVSALGIYAVLLGATHGYLEILQGDSAPRAVLINAIGPPCQPEVVWHACLPAMTIVPNFSAAGAVTILLSLVTLIWAVVFIRRRHGGLILMGLSVLMLLAGGGFIATFVGLIAGGAGTGLGTSPTSRKPRLPAPMQNVLANLWPWSLIAFLAWSLMQWLLGYFINQAMISISCALLLFSYFALPLLTVMTGIAHDTENAHDK